MRLTIDSGKLLYALGVLFAAAALVYFSRDVVFDLSITVKAALLLVGFVAFFLAGLRVQRDVLDVVAFAVSGVTYVAFVGYVVVRYQPGETGTFLLLAASAALFVGLGYALREGLPTPSRRTTGLAVGGLLLVGGVLVGADALTGGVTYDLETAESVAVPAPDPGEGPDSYPYVSREIGTVTAQNPSPFLRALRLPVLSGCLLGPVETRPNDVYVSLDSDFSERSIPGATTRRYAVTAELPVDPNRTEPRTIAIERDAECSAERAEPTLVVRIEADDSRS